MNCPKCGGDTTVFSSRKKDGGKVMRRRRQCLVCFTRFTTEELKTKNEQEEIAWQTESKDEHR